MSPTATTTTHPAHEPNGADAALPGPIGEPAVRPDNGAGVITTALATARRTVLQFFRTPQLLMMGTVQGALFLFMFRDVFGGAISTGGSLSYVDFLVPGFLVTVILWTGMGAAAGVAEDSASGVYDRLRSLPIPRASVMVGRSLADITLVGWGMLVTGALGFVLGFRVHAGIGSFLLACVLMLVVPFSFISSANVPISSMPGWMQPFAANQPISVIINAVRSLMQGGTEAVGIGHTTTYWVVLSLAWSVGILLVFGALATARFSRTT